MKVCCSRSHLQRIGEIDLNPTPNALHYKFSLSFKLGLSYKFAYCSHETMFIASIIFLFSSDPLNMRGNRRRVRVVDGSA